MDYNAQTLHLNALLKASKTPRTSKKLIPHHNALIKMDWS